MPRGQFADAPAVLRFLRPPELRERDGPACDRTSRRFHAAADAIRDHRRHARRALGVGERLDQQHVDVAIGFAGAEAARAVRIAVDLDRGYAPPQARVARRQHESPLLRDAARGEFEVGRERLRIAAEQRSETAQETFQLRRLAERELPRFAVAARDLALAVGDAHRFRVRRGDRLAEPTGTEIFQFPVQDQRPIEQAGETHFGIRRTRGWIALQCRDQRGRIRRRGETRQRGPRETRQHRFPHSRCHAS